MLYLVALLVPPIAILFCGKPFQAIINLGILGISFFAIILALPLTIPLCVIHGLFVVHNFYADQRNARVIRAVREAAEDQEDLAEDLRKERRRRSRMLPGDDC